MEVIIKTSASAAPIPDTCAKSVDPGAHHSLQSAEMPQQRAALGRPEPGHDLEHRLVVAPRALAAVPGDGEAMRLVADALDEARRGAECAAGVTGALAP